MYSDNWFDSRNHHNEIISYFNQSMFTVFIMVFKRTRKIQCTVWQRIYVTVGERRCYIDAACNHIKLMAVHAAGRARSIVAVKAMARARDTGRNTAPRRPPARAHTRRRARAGQPSVRRPLSQSVLDRLPVLGSRCNRIFVVACS